MIKMVLFVQGLIGTVKAIASEVCDNTNQVDSDKFSKSWTYFKAIDMPFSIPIFRPVLSLPTHYLVHLV